MQNGCEQFHAVDESRARAAEVGGRIDNVKIRPLFASLLPCITGLSDALELIDRTLDGVPARHYEDYVGPSGFHGMPRRFMRWSILRSEDIEATGQRNHFWNPVTCDIERIQPFQTHHARARGRPTGCGAHVVHSTMEFLGECPSLRECVCRLGDALDIMDHVVQRGWTEREHVGSMLE